MDGIDSLRDTIIPKSDQLNADDLLAGPITVTIAAVKRGNADQPLDLVIDGRQPFKPCKSMRRVLISAWGDDGRVWVGRSMTLYADPEVKWGGVKVGGIRISHLSHIDNDLSLSLTAAKGKRAPHLVRRLEVAAPVVAAPKQPSAAALAKIEAAKTAGRAAAAQGGEALAAWIQSLNQQQQTYFTDFIAELEGLALNAIPTIEEV